MLSGWSPLVGAADRAREAADAAGRESGAPAMLVTRRSVTVTGNGDVPDLPVITFDAPYLTEPAFSSGAALLARPDPAHWRFPVASLFMVSWVLNDRGLYVGAQLAASIFVPPQPNVVPPSPPQVSLVFHAVFTGTGVKTTGSLLTGPEERPAVLA